MKNIYIFLSIIMIAGCQSSIQKKIVYNIKLNCKNPDTCVLNIENVTNFKWDKLYIFNEDVHLEELNKVLGFNYEYFKDIARRIIFTRGNKVVYHEDDYPYPEEKFKGKVIFDLGFDTVKYAIFTNNEAIFKIHRKKIEGFEYYELTPSVANLPYIIQSVTNFDSLYLAQNIIKYNDFSELVLYIEKGDTLNLRINQKKANDDSLDFKNLPGYINPKFYLNNHLLYFNNKNYSSYYLKKKSIVIILHRPNLIYFLIEKYDAIDNNKYEIYQFKNNSIIYLRDTYSGYLGDFENNGLFEVGGFSISESDDNFNIKNLEMYQICDSIRFDSIACRIIFNKIEK